MFLFLVVLALWVFICFSFNRFEVNDDSLASSIFGSAIWALLLVGVVCSNYSTFLDNRAFYDVGAETSATAVQAYAANSDGLQYQALTDSRGEGYQAALSSAIEGLRYKVVKYNKWYVTSKVGVANNFLSWWYMGPDADMGTITITKDLKLIKNVGK